MSERRELTKLIVNLIATTGPIWRNQPVNACPDDDPVGEPRPMKAVPVNDMTQFIDGLLDFLTAHDEQIRAAERECVLTEVRAAIPLRFRDGTEFMYELNDEEEALRKIAVLSAPSSTGGNDHE